MAKKSSRSTKPKKLKLITAKQLPAFQASRLLLVANRFVEVRFTFKVKTWVENHQYYVTRIVFSDSINQSKLDSVIDIASRCGYLRQDLWNKYGSLQAWGISTNKVRDEAKKVFAPEKYGIPYKIWDLLLWMLLMTFMLVKTLLRLL